MSLPSEKPSGVRPVNKDNEKLVVRYYQEVMNEGQGDMEKFDEFLVSNAVLHNSFPKPSVGPEEWKNPVRFSRLLFQM